MFYRGRLTDGDVKVLVIGQEGAQDESARAPLVRRRHGRPHAARPQPPRHHPLVPVPEHVRVPDHRAVRRAAAGPGPGSRTRRSCSTALAIYDEVLEPQRPPAGDRGRQPRPRRASSPGSRRGAAPARRARTTSASSRPPVCSAPAPRPSACSTRVAPPPGGSKAAIVADFKAKLGVIDGWADDDPVVARPVMPGATRTPAVRLHSTRATRSRSGTCPFGTCLAARLGRRRRATARTTSARSSCSPTAGIYNGEGDASHYASERRRHRRGLRRRRRQISPTSRREGADPEAHDRGPDGGHGASSSSGGARASVARLRRPRRAEPTRRSAGARSTGAATKALSVLVLADQEIERRPVHRLGP